MMERFSDDADNIQKILTWVENKQDIINFLRKVPLDQSHLRIPLSISYFLNLRDQSEENSEQNIENDAREIVIILPDTPYRYIKYRLRDLGNIPNRKEVVVKQIIKERPELSKILTEITDKNTVRKRTSDKSTSVSEIKDNETNIKIKIRKVEGSLEVVSSIKQEIVPNKPNFDETTSRNSSDNDIKLENNSIQINCSGVSKTVHKDPDIKFINNSTQIESLDVCTTVRSPSINLPSTSTTVYRDPSINLPSTSTTVYRDSSASTSTTVYRDPTNNLPSMLAGFNHKLDNFRRGEQNPTDFSNANCAFIDITPQASDKTRESYHNHPTGVPFEMNTQTKTSKEVPSTAFNLVEYLKDLTECSTDRITSACQRFNVDINENPGDLVMNTLVNHLLDNVIVLDDTDCDKYTDAIDLSNPADYESTDEEEIPAEMITKANVNTRTLLKPPTLLYNATPSVSKEVGAPSPPSKNIIQPCRLNLPRGRVIPAVPQAFMDRINNRCDETGDLTEMHPPSDPVDESAPQAHLPVIQEAQPAAHCDERLVLRVIEMFPEACPKYIRKISQGKDWKDLDDVVTIILSEESYPKRPQRPPSPPKEFDIEVQLEIVKALLPDADPTYLRWKCETIGNNPEALNEFINDARETHSYPTMKEYLRKQKLSAQSKQYTTEFKVEKFVELFPDPEKTFRDPKRTVEIDNYTSLYVCTFFQNRYDKLPIKMIRSILAVRDNNIMLSDDAMRQAFESGNTMKTRRKPSTLQDAPQNIAVLQELAYLTHKEEIQEYIRGEKTKEENERRVAKENGLLNTCECCYDDEIMPKDSFSCPKNCTFCRACIQQSCEVALGDAKTEFKCLNNCSEEFTLHTLQKVLPPKMFSKLAQKKALAEVKAAGIEELEPCPFCDFASIPNPEDKIFRCLNPDCMKESCRLCKEENHVPYKCDEVEKDEDVKARVFVENQMTEALLRKCWKCSTSFFKEEGCNMMTCTCGAKLCYICKQPVKDYSHFNGIGGDKFELCPLYSDTNSLNENNVLKAAQAAKSKIDPNKLKVDPSSDIKKHYEKRKRELPEEPHVQLLQDVRRMQELQAFNNVAQVGRAQAIDLRRMIAEQRHRHRFQHHHVLHHQRHHPGQGDRRD